MRLTMEDQARLNGEAGPATQMAMQLVLAAGEAMGATELLDITAAHIDGCLYHGLAGLDFARRLAEAGAMVAVPTTLNVSSLDLLHPTLYRGDAATAARARALMQAYESMGCRPTWTCAPYQLADRPVFGQQIAWGESNAIVFANSVIGARTNRYGDFLDICCALTGRAPATGLHLERGRRAHIHVDVDVPDVFRDDDLLYVAIGHVVGRLAGTSVVAITGLDIRADEDRLKALGAAAASSGAVGMFHVVGVTPEAPTLQMAFQGERPEREITLTGKDLRLALTGLGPADGRLAAVSIGTPHASLVELERLARLCEGHEAVVPFYVNTGRDVLKEAGHVSAIIEAFGATFVTDTCTYITPILEQLDGAVMTNSGKWAFYAPANLGVDVMLGTLADCVDSAIAGSPIRMGELA